MFSASLRASAGVDREAAAPTMAAGSGLALRWFMVVSSAISWPVGLLENERAIDVVGNADAPALAMIWNTFGEHGAPHAGARRIAERAVALTPDVICETSS